MIYLLGEKKNKFGCLRLQDSFDLKHGFTKYFGSLKGLYLFITLIFIMYQFYKNEQNCVCKKCYFSADPYTMLALSVAEQIVNHHYVVPRVVSALVNRKPFWILHKAKLSCEV